MKTGIAYRLPFFLTFSRIGLAVIFSITFARGSRVGYTMTLIIFILAIITDIFDGYIARKLKVCSDFGTFLDGMADKLVVIVSIVSLLKIGAVSYPCTIVLLMREILADAIRNYLARTNQGIRHDVFGRLQMTCTTLAVSCKLVMLEITGSPVGKVVFGTDIILYAGVIFGIFSIREAWPIFPKFFGASKRNEL